MVYINLLLLVNFLSLLIFIHSLVMMIFSWALLFHSLDSYPYKWTWNSTGQRAIYCANSKSGIFEAKARQASKASFVWEMVVAQSCNAVFCPWSFVTAGTTYLVFMISSLLSDNWSLGCPASHTHSGHFWAILSVIVQRLKFACTPFRTTNNDL